MNKLDQFILFKPTWLLSRFYVFIVLLVAVKTSARQDSNPHPLLTGLDEHIALNLEQYMYGM